ncbi:hypothetical protein PFICI_01956 [Pestalotiopsis fici W106-1]|uniref:HTH La-type RNA-binding domain-containing protein n=1 Tax=Pestalotiopsis fici (strain W106-1 / CGMCC3.15140) TaxID=1229662 RepID=W3XPZ9_PESFW|nr:uncharacterized protein PFICI_01956 [Pestalotiopsis fici W106-1]ETS88128.1 hypothetical protein PFICI_01956 [Pestalotiopsis fici W106-1]
MSTFSYAQAAKGQLSTASSAPQPAVSQAASTTSNQGADSSAPAGEAAASQSIAASTTSNDADVKSANTQSVTPDDSQNKSDSDIPSQSAQGAEIVQESAATDVAVSASTEKKQGAETPERRVKGGSARSDTSDNRKPRKGKKSKAADKDSDQEQTAEKEKEPEAPKVQLSEAPIPTVNIWVQRAKEAQTKTVQPVPARTSSTATANAQDSKAKTAASEVDNSGRSSVNVNKGQRKDVSKDAAEQAPRRHTARGGKAFEKTSGESLPSVADAASWPTPETAATEIKSQETVSKPAETEEASEDKADSGPKDKPKWVAIPFVPSAVFETPLPSRNPRGSKTGAPRGGRETGARGHAGLSNPAERTQASGAARASGEKFDGANGSKAAAAAPAKRADVDAGVSRDARKASGAAKEGLNTTPTINGADEPVKAAQSESKDQSQASETPNEKKSETRPDPSRESFTPAAKENNHHHVPKSEKRNNRGRGGHSGANGQGHRGHGGFGSNGQPFNGHMNSRQNSYPGNVSIGYGMPGGPTNGHSSRNSTSGGFYRGNGRNGRGNNVQAANWNVDPAMQAMPAMMAPQPYWYEQQNILAMLTRQLSYYFSVNNLLKDSYLRRCMDSQGYVFLDVIQNFTRIQQLTPDPHMLRIACVECPDVELVTGIEDNRDRIRRVKEWKTYVYPTGSRNEEVNFDEGPANVFKHDRSTMYPTPYMNQHHYPVESNGFYPNGAQFTGYGHDGFQPYGMMNGINGQTHPNGTPLSAEVPEFSPKNGSSASDAEQTKGAAGKENQVNGTKHLTNGTGMVNGHSHTNGTEPVTAQ